MIKLLGLIAAFSISASAHAKDRVYFIQPDDGAIVTSPLKVEFGVEGMKVGKAGKVLRGVGHHHLIIDGKAIPKGKVVPSDKTHIHFGGGQTEAELTLAPGHHTLTLQFADGAHRSYGPTMSSTIHVTVVAQKTEEKK